MKTKIPEYNNQEEKRKFFTLEIIDTDQQLYNFMSLLPKLYNEEKGIWRGLPESRFKLYNSLQRDNIITDELKSLDHVIKRIIDSATKLSDWNRSLIQKYFSNYGIENVSIYAKLSILQHHECKTPLLDWTRNPNVALYFATLSSINAQIEDVIDNYFSIYFLENEHPYFRFSSETGVDLLISDNQTKEEINAYFNNDNNIIRSIYDFPIQKIDDKSNKLVNHYTMSNYNISAQDGLFILNADPYKPLEEAILNRICDLASKEKLSEIDVNEAMNINRRNFVCYDIHKKFIPKVIEALNSEKINITKETMFPDFKKLKHEIMFEKTTENIR